MTKKMYWKGLTAAEKRALAIAIGTSVDYLRQVFVHGKKTGADRARRLFVETGGSVGAHEFCPGAFSEADRLDVNSGDTAA